MRLLELFEARSNLKQNNAREKGHDAALPIVKQLFENNPNIGVSMTELPKLGINPSSSYETPIAICFYPAAFYIEKIESESELPFQHGAPYIQILEATGNVLKIDEMDNGAYGEMVKKLFKNSSKIAYELKTDPVDFELLLTEASMEAGREARVSTYGGQFWYILYKISKTTGNKKKSEAGVHKSAVVWNKILRLLGIQAIIDNGDGILHPSEPYQGMIFDPKAVKLIKTIGNHRVGYKPGVDLDFWVEAYNKFAPPQEYIRFVCDGVIYHTLEIVDANPSLAKKTGYKMAIMINKDPSLLAKIPEKHIRIITKLADKPSVTKALYKLLVMEDWKTISSKIPQLEMLINLAEDPAAKPEVKKGVIDAMRHEIGLMDQLVNKISKIGANDDANIRDMMQVITRFRARVANLGG